MSYLLDTNILSELTRTAPHKSVLQWFKMVPNEALHISVLTLGELRSVIDKLTGTPRKEKLRLWLEIELPAWFQERILPINEHVADRWGRLQTEVKRTLPAIDSLIAATALHYDLRVVTRNEKDFKYSSLEVINPWKI